MHVPAPVRDALLAWLSLFDGRHPIVVLRDGPADHPGRRFSFEHDGQRRSLAWLFAMLTHSSDQLPPATARQLDLPRGAFYSTAAEALRELAEPDKATADAA